MKPPTKPQKSPTKSLQFLVSPGRTRPVIVILVHILRLNIHQNRLSPKGGWMDACLSPPAAPLSQAKLQFILKTEPMRTKVDIVIDSGRNEVQPKRSLALQSPSAAQKNP